MFLVLLNFYTQCEAKYHPPRHGGGGGEFVIGVMMMMELIMSVDITNS